MDIEDFMFWAEDLPELENSVNMKEAIGTAILGFGLMENPDQAIDKVCPLIIDKFKESILPSPDFIRHPANRVSAFASDADWLTAYMRYMLQKVDNLTAISRELGGSRIGRLRIIDADDPGVCRGCAGQKKIISDLSEIDYQDIPPFHFGCRCSFLLLK